MRDIETIRQMAFVIYPKVQKDDQSKSIQTPGQCTKMGQWPNPPQKEAQPAATENKVIFHNEYMTTYNIVALYGLGQ